MQVECEAAYLHRFVISHYQNAIAKKKYNGQKTSLEVYQEYMLIRDEKDQSQIDRYKYSNMTCLSYFKKDPKKHIFVIQEKAYGKSYSGSFRVAEEQACKVIYEFVNDKTKLSSNANQVEPLMQRKQIIQKVRQSRSQFKEVYQRDPALFSAEWLDSIFFQRHEQLKEYDLAAQIKAEQNQRKLITDKAKNRLKREERTVIDGPLENYDFQKMNEGPRFFDSHKQSQFVARVQDKEEDIIVEQIDHKGFPHFLDTLEGMVLNQKMDIEDDQPRKISPTVQKTFETGLRLPEASKGKFKLNQRRVDEGPRRQRQFRDKQGVTSNTHVSKSIILWIKIFYQILGHSQLRREHIVTIDGELNRLSHMEKLSSEVKEAVEKTQQRILEWKRSEGRSWQP